MPEFVDTDEGWINIDHVETITEKTHDGIRRPTFYDAASRRMGAKAMWDPFEHNGHIVQPNPPTVRARSSRSCRTESGHSYTP